MPALIKPWLKYPPNTSTPINDVSLKALEARTSNYTGAQDIGPGVNGTSDFQVTQTGVASMILNVGLPNALMSAFIAWDTLGSTARYDYSGTQRTVNVGTADARNPRVDRVVLTPTIDQSTPTPQILPGTPTGGATLANLTGAQAVPVGSLLLADVLVAAGATSIANAAIQDRRGLPIENVSAWGGNFPAVDAVTMMPHYLASPSNSGQSAGTISTANTNQQVAALHFLKRRVKGATRLRWRYQQGGTAMTGAYNLAIYEPGGRKIIETGALGFAGALNTYQTRNEPIAATDFEAGAYVVMIGVQTLAGGNIYAAGAQVGVGTGGANPGINQPGIAWVSGVNGTTLPQFYTGLGDMITAGLITTCVIPTLAISVS